MHISLCSANKNNLILTTYIRIFLSRIATNSLAIVHNLNLSTYAGIYN